MKLRLRWQGWKAELTPRALRLLVITAVLVLAAGADALPPSLRPPPEPPPLVATVPVQIFNPARADSIKLLIAVPPAPVAIAPATRVVARTEERTSPQDARTGDEQFKRELMLPLPGLNTRDLHDSFNDLRDGGNRRHHAIDLDAERGTPVLSVDDGTVAKLHYSQSGGISLYARDPSGRYIYYYAHLDSYHPRMRVGLPLARGDTVGFVGTTGNAAANGPHLHFAILKPSRGNWNAATPVNPFAILRRPATPDR